MAVPVAISLVLLARLAAQQAMRWAQLAAARLRAQERLELLGQGLAPSLPAACVQVRASAALRAEEHARSLQSGAQQGNAPHRATYSPWSGAGCRSCRRSRRSCRRR